MKNVSVIGTGRWGTFLAWYLATKKDRNVILYGLEDSKTFQELKKKGKNQYLTLPKKVKMTSGIEETLNSEYIIISIDAQNLKNLASQLNNFNLDNKIFILAMKGIDVEYKKRLTEIMKDKIKQNIGIAVLLGPGHVEDYTKGIPNCVVIDSDDKNVKVSVAELMRSDLMRIYYGTDLIGNEIGGAYKNVIGIAAGILDGLNWSSLKGALMARSIAEVGRFILYHGGNPKSASGLAFLGDFEATLFSKYSNNRMFGELFIKNEVDTTKNYEGYHTLKSVYEMGKSANLDLPITYTLYDVIYNKKPITESLNNLFGRDLKNEF